MKLKSFLNEIILAEKEEKAAEIAKIVKKDCKPFLQTKKGCKKNWLFRGSKISPAKLIIRKTVRKNRHPIDTPKDVHKLIDNAFLKRFGWKARSNAIFALGFHDLQFPHLATGQDWLCFPIGKFRFIWSDEIADLYGDYITTFDFRDWYDEHDPKKEEIMLNDLMDRYTDKNFCAALDAGHEIMIQSKEYYMVNNELFSHLTKLL